MNIKGVFLEEVSPSTPAFEAGLRKGDIIIQIENQGVSNAKSFKAIWKSYKHLTKKRIYIYRNGYTLLAVIKEK